MKKLRKLLCVLSASAVCAAGAMPVSAYGLPDINTAIYTYTGYTEPDASVYYSHTYVIGEDNKYGYISTFKPTSIIVKTEDGSEPVLEEDSGLTCEKYEPVTNIYSSAIWTTFIDIGTEYSDNLYVISGFDSSTYDAIEYCRTLIREGKAEIANPYMRSAMNIFVPEFKASYLEDGYVKGQFITTLEFSDNASAESFDPDTIENFSENINVITTTENKVIFQMKSGTDSVLYSEILSSIEKNYEISEIFLTGGVLESAGAAFQGVISAFDSGDVNFDEQIDVFDAINVAKITVGDTSFNSEQKFLADFNSDSTVDVFDAVAIAKETVK